MIRQRCGGILAGVLGLASVIGGCNRPAAILADLGEASRRGAVAEAMLVPSPAAPVPSTPGLLDSLTTNLQSAVTAREYWVSEHGERLQAPNRRHDLRSHFDQTGVQVHDRTPSATSKLVALRLASLGRGDRLTPVVPGEIRHDKGRVEIARPAIDLVEWFENSDAGLEHGFTLALRPEPRQRANDLVLELAVESAAASLRGDAVALATESGRTLSYAKLVVVDARGRQLAARFEVPASDRLQLIVADRDAIYPIVIDPLLTGTADAVIQRNLAGGGTTDAASAGDVNGDGYEDLIVGSIGGAVEHVVYIYHGGPNGVASGGPAQANTTLAALTTTAFGGSVASAGDVNGDGYDDIVVGASLYDGGQTNEGAAFLFLGGPDGIPSGGPPSASAILESNQASAQFGGDVASAGDVNGDGFDDVIVGSRSYDLGQTNEGLAFIYLGSANGIANGSPATASALLEGNQADALFGHSVASAGDVNADGYADVIVGAQTYDNDGLNEGAAFVFLGSALGITSGHPGTAATVLEPNQAAGGSGAAPFFGSSVASAGDVDGDGYSDVIVGAPGYNNPQIDEGAVFIFLGSTSGIASGNPATAATILDSNQEGVGSASPNFGSAVSSAGDVNGDGYADVVIGAGAYDDGGPNRGAVFVAFGTATGVPNGPATTTTRQLQMTQDNAGLGTAVASAGDVDGDGFDDVVVAANGYDAGELNEGAAFVYHGGGIGNPAAFFGGSDQASLVTGQSSASFGWSIASAGDVNGDGYSDVIVGAPLYDAGQSDEGAAFIFLGSASGIASATDLSAATVLTVDQDNAFLGRRVASAGDVNGDGYGDVLVGATGYDSGETDEGAAFIFLGSASGIASGGVASAHARLEADQAGALLGFGAASAGDVNGDGYGDVAVGAPGYDNGTVDEGAAFVFLGSASGIASGNPATASAILESNQGSNSTGILTGSILFAGSLSSAGDVNGDGYGDLIVGAPGYEIGFTDGGAVFVFLGSASGIASGNPATAHAFVFANFDSMWLGLSATSAGDVNGDGFGDIVVGVRGVPPAGGPSALVFLGSAAGIASGSLALTHAILSGDSPNSLVYAVNTSAAGDVNRDGYSDVLLAATPTVPGPPGYDPSGYAYVYLGSPAGMTSGGSNSAPIRIGSIPSSTGNFFVEVGAAAGDVNGDGFADLITGARGANSASVFLGNTKGRPVLARQYRGDGSGVPVQPGATAHSSDSFIAELTTRSAFGRERAKIEVEVCPIGSPFGDVDCLHRTSANWIDMGTTGAVLSETVTGLTPTTLYSWRARMLTTPYSSTQPGVVPIVTRGPWTRVQARATTGDFRTSVPEPGGTAALVSGVVWVLALRRRRAQQEAEARAS